MKLLLHACCGPCSLEPVRVFAEEGFDLTLAYINPNIHPQDEYMHRLDTLNTWAKSAGLDVLEGEYDPDAWERTAGIFGTDRAERCRACYRIRFERAANLALSKGFDALGSTLSVSPYQFTEIIEEELKRAASLAGIEAVFRDFRPLYPRSTVRSRELEMYRQNYCGCHFSDVEAQVERKERRAARKAAKEAKRRAREKALAEQGDLPLSDTGGGMR